MIKTEKYHNIDKNTLRQKGWMWFSFVICLQILFLFAGILFK